MLNNFTGSAFQREVVITRVFDAPRDLVWKAWTEPEHLMRWWGPEHFTAPMCRVDLRMGGKFVYCMRSPEGQDFWNTGVFFRIATPEIIVCTMSFADEHGDQVPASHYGMPGNWPEAILLTVTLEELEGKTRLTVREAGIPREMSEMAEAGWKTSLDKFADVLASMQPH